MHGISRDWLVPLLAMAVVTATMGPVGAYVVRSRVSAEGGRVDQLRSSME